MAKNDPSHQPSEYGMPILDSLPQSVEHSTRITEDLTPNLITEQAIAEVSHAAANRKPIITTRGLTKVYRIHHGPEFTALRNISLEVQSGEFVAIMGPSGSGKSTLMNLLGCLDTPTFGEYIIDGKRVGPLSSDKLADIRSETIGFVFQNFNLLDRATALRNVELPMRYADYPRHERERRARKLLTLVGMEDRMHHKPNELSGGQQQRLAIARALVNGPSLLLADEPTGNLDSKTSIEIMSVLQSLNEQGLTIILITHDRNIASYASRLVQLLDGSIVSDVLISQPRSALEDWLALENRTTPENIVEATDEGNEQHA
jgi:putative ABC transport system ATP-binding protein